MKLLQFAKRVLIALAVVGMTVPNITLAADAPVGPDREAAAPMVSDVMLHQNGTLVGQVFDKSGAPQKQVDVTISHASHKVASVRTDEQGRFAVQGLRGGVHVFQTPKSTSVCRLWTKEVAPPHAEEGVALVNDSDVVRGNNGGGFGVNTKVVAGVLIAGAIIGTAIYVADDDDDAS